MSRQRKNHRTLRTALIGAGVVVLASLPLVPASAQGLLESLFASLHRARIPPNVQAFSDPFEFLRGQRNPQPAPRSYAGGGGPAHCVRTCDGMHFPLQRSAGNPVELCHAFCPGSATKVVYGGSIDTAVASDGTHYADFDNAYVYRDHIVSNCTCNGRDAFGLATLDAKNDPTLRPGDIVATPSGLTAYTGGRNGNAEFTPVAQYGNFPKAYRDKLSELKVSPPVIEPATTGSIGQAAREERRRAQQ